MAILAGTWLPHAEPFKGHRRITLNGVVFRIPDTAAYKIVNAGKIQIAHVLTADRRVYVLSGRGLLDQTDQRRKTNAHEWSSIAGEHVGPART